MTPLFDFERFPALESNRLILREIIASDDDSIFAIRGDYEVTKYNSGKAYTHIGQAQGLITAMSEAYVEKTQLRWGITLKPDSTVIGMCGFNYWDRTDHRASIGFDLKRSHWRNGIMQEAVRMILDFGFTSMNLNRIEADASIYNEASTGLLRKLGFQQEGHQREQYYENGTYHDLLLFALLKYERTSSSITL